MKKCIGTRNGIIVFGISIALLSVGCKSDATVNSQTDVTKDSVDVVDTNTNPIDTNTADSTRKCVVGDDVGCDPVIPTDSIDQVDPVPEDSVGTDTITIPDYCVIGDTAPDCMYPGQDVGN